jgi:predicted RNase H-like HicB family nuclease
MEQKRRTAKMNQAYTALIKKDAGWWIGWIEEIPGVNCQEASRDELLASLRITLQEALDLRSHAG